MTRTLIPVLALALLTASANAALITPTGATASSQLSSQYDAGNLIDDSGLSGTDPHVITDTHTGFTNVAWVSDGVALPHTVTFDLGASYDLTDLHIWQYSHGTANWSKDITVQFSTTGTGGTFGSDLAIQLADGSVSEIAQNFALGSPITANAVKFTITSRTGAGTTHAALSEVKFSKVVPTPESAIENRPGQVKQNTGATLTDTSGAQG